MLAAPQANTEKMTTKNASPARSQRKTQRVHNANLKPWPDNPPGYTFLGEVVREVYERLCPPSTELSEQRLFAAIEQIRQDALAGRLALGHFDGDAFAVLGGARLLAGDWRQLFLSCSVESADVFVRDRELDYYVQFIDRVRAAN